MARVSRRLSFHVYADTDSHAHADTGAARAPAPTVTNVTGSHVDAIQLVWNTEAGVTRYQVQYRVQGVDDPWILDSNQIVSPRGQPEVVHEIDSLSVQNPQVTLALSSCLMAVNEVVRQVTNEVG